MSLLSAAQAPRLFDLRLPPLPLAHGGTVDPHHARGFWWGPEQDLPALTARTRLLGAIPTGKVIRRPEAVPFTRCSDAPDFSKDVPTVLLVHALTGDARAGGDAGWWSPLMGVGRVLDPAKCRILCFNNLGSCYGSSGPLDNGFPEEAVASLTPWDTARALLQALDVLEVDTLALVAGGSLGGMVALSLAALAPHRVQRLLPVATSAASSAWVLGFNHVARQVLTLTESSRCLEVARQLAMLTYRAEAGLELRQGRHLKPSVGAACGPYPIQSYLEHQGEKLRQRFDRRAYLAQLSAMDHHDLFAPPPGEEGPPALARISASTLAVDVDTDQLFTPAQVAVLADALAAAGAYVERATLRSAHGHDAFLMEWNQLEALLERALALPEPEAPVRRTP